ncbi:hypothetical protein [Pseudomonas sp. Teo4]|uniref:hypothetical protein n=1 Tax=Pseudomonas sp. Teo4 TaxID=3064528 RepID=UPI002ABBA773|nr:hypothetical protein [Pseudomonas sp. Teo4]MDZ3994065.1 hypothetical protein [Pseudomonas sp. Teo4]
MSQEPNKSIIGDSQFFVVSSRKIAVMSFFTFGWYWLFCFHRSWVLHRVRSGERVLPLVRALFAVIFFYPLLRRIDQKICQSGRSYKWSPAVLTVFFIIAGLSPMLVDQGLWLQHYHLAILIFLTSYLLHVWVIVSVQRAVNFCEGDNHGQANSTFSIANWLWMALGLLVWPTMIFMALISLLLGFDPAGG